jgi:quercetin 2,3-dioxygenase
MVTLRKGTDRGTTRIDWLNSRHSFSFGDFIDPQYHHFHALRVINDDIIGASGGFPAHPHRDMEILTYVLTGQLDHKDNLGTVETIHAGEWQRMTAGRGIVHSEYNPSKTEAVHLLQIWIMPEAKGLIPTYEQKVIPPGENHWRTVASRDGRAESLVIMQDAIVQTAMLASGRSLDVTLNPGRAAWLHVIDGQVTIGTQTLTPGDSVAIEKESAVTILAQETAHLLQFDLRAT